MFSSKRDSLVVPGIGTIQDFLGQEPSQSHLSGRDLLRRGDFFHQIHHGLIGLAGFGSVKARNDIAEIAFDKLGVGVNFAR